ncbi:NADPH-dependent F420 reductase [Nocardia sp. NPDC052566]|uniref:NADPH-dependent F420 reductase n=1 Tax=Nocardia sp. NPDC052566 TaxID=3364330 RepID=UPI0037C70F77
MTSSTTHQIGILGAGKLGQPIGRHWAIAGHSVILGSRSPRTLAPAVADWEQEARVTDLAEAADLAEVVLLTVPNPALDELLATVGERLRGKIVIDATNPIGRSADGRIISVLRPGLTQGRRTAEALPDSRVVRAFTHVMYELLWSRGTQQRAAWGMALAGDDEQAKDTVAQLISDTGFTPVDIGGLDDSAALEPGGALFPRMFAPADLRVAAGLATSV